MSQLAIHNPATGEPIAEVAADDPGTVAAKAEAARQAQPAWAARPLEERKACIDRFRDGVVRELEALAVTMKDPTYVCDDADPVAAAQSLADGAMYNTGQSCCSVERIYVHERIHDAFVAAFVETVQRFKVGDPMSEATYIGPLPRAAQRDVLDAQVADAKAQGAQLHTGGHRLKGPGNWYAPTVLGNVHHGMALMKKESFGPIIGIQQVAGDEEAVRLMNDTRYGLTAGVYSRDGERAQAVLSRVNAGSLYWNCCDRVSPRLPWTGFGDSGIGVTLSTYGIQTLTRLRAWHLRSDG